MTFSTIHAALRAERAFLERGFAIELIPVPRGISSGCGYCVKAVAPIEVSKEAAIRALALELSCEVVWMETTSAAEAASAESRGKEKRYERIDSGH